MAKNLAAMETEAEKENKSLKLNCFETNIIKKKKSSTFRGKTLF